MEISIYCLCFFIATCYSQTSMVSINRKIDPVWSETLVETITKDDYIDGTTLLNIKVITLHFAPISEYEDLVKGIRNFQHLTEVYMDKHDSTRVPKFKNTPKLQKISMQNNKLESIPSNALSISSLKIVIFSGNAISRIGDGAFGTKIEEIFLTCNKIKVMLPKWFKNPKKIKVFSIGGNEIEHVPEDMFKGFVNLKELTLRNNKIKTLGKGCFGGFRAINILQMSYNNINEIQTNILGDDPMILKINTLDIQYNNLTFLHSDLLNRIRVVNTLLIWGNPWQCPCRDNLINWWYNTTDDKTRYDSAGLKRDGDPSCVLAQSFQNTCVFAVDTELQEYYEKNFEHGNVNFCEIFA